MSIRTSIELSPYPELGSTDNAWQRREGAALSDKRVGSNSPQAIERISGGVTFPLPELLLTDAPKSLNGKEKDGASTVTTKIGEQEFVVKTNGQGKPDYCKDASGEWNSSDGGKTWTNKQNENHVWRGSVSIDSGKNYINVSSDYGWTRVTQSDGSRRREITTESGNQYAVVTDSQGRPTYFKDTSGEWTSADGSAWTNQRTGGKKTGSVAIDSYGEFRFGSADGSAVVFRSEQLEKIKREEGLLTRDFGVKFIGAGETSMYDGTKITNGVPTLAELDCLRDVLQKTRHEDYKNLKLWFIKDGDVSMQTLWGFYRNSGTSGGPNMFVMPLARGQIRGWNALEGTLYHELTHHEQYQRWGNTNFGQPGSPAETKDLMQRLGWDYSVKHGYVIKDKTGGVWSRTDGKWNWVLGKRPADGATQLTSSEMRERALFKPATSYFTYPSEEHAEGAAMLRMDRANLARQSPAVYKVMRDFDQQSIDRTFGKDSKGASKLIRAIDGQLVPNAEATRKAIAAQESSWGIK